MSTYVMTDIHGCFKKMNGMLEKINLTNNDKLIIAGDYIDRGPQSYEMLRWLESKPENVVLLRGNHDEEFAYCIDLLYGLVKKEGMVIDSYSDTCLAYEMMVVLTGQKDSSIKFFDHYGTIAHLIYEYEVTLQKMVEWKDLIRKMPFVYKGEISSKQYVVVHAGYIESLDEVELEEEYGSLEEFYIYARDDAYMFGGIKDGIVIAGHTPTIFQEELPYNYGKVYMSYDEELNCKFYNIDCGCAYGKEGFETSLACIRIDDEEIFYV